MALCHWIAGVLVAKCSGEKLLGARLSEVTQDLRRRRKMDSPETKHDASSLVGMISTLSTTAMEMSPAMA